MNDIYRIEDGKMIIGKTIPVFIENAGLHLTDLKIYQDGMIDCWRMVTLEGLKDLIKSGWIVTSVKGSVDFSMFPLGYVKSGELLYSMKEDELVKEVQDITNDLNDQPTSRIICRQAFKDYLADKSDENKDKLKTAYENIPEHNRAYVLGDIAVDDIPIRIVLYGAEGEKKEMKYQFSFGKIEKYLNGEIDF